MKTSDFDYPLPSHLIAQTPIEPRDRSRLLVLSRADGSMEHRRFFEIVDYLKPGDLLVCNDSRVIPARLLGRKTNGGGRVEILLLRQLEQGVWETLLRPGRRLREGTVIEIGDRDRGLSGEVLARTGAGTGVVRFSDENALEELGTVPLPPYIHTPLSDLERYQTVYARIKGSAAAPTAGLHFTPELISRIREKGADFVFVTLHVGLDSFRPVQVEDPQEHTLHREYFELGEETCREISRARAEGRRIICVGTTSVRVLEEVARRGEELRPGQSWASLFIRPGHRFRLVDALITNFHLPRSTLLMLVSAFAGPRLVRRAYQEAISERYRFYSFGDAMLIS